MSGPVLLVRADANPRIGSGHLVRSVALAQAWQSLGGEAVLITNSDPATLPSGTPSSDLGLVLLEEMHPHPDDLRRVLGLGAGRSGAAVSCDGYHFDADYTRALQDAGHRVLVIDDIAAASRYAADVIVNQNIHAERLTYACDPMTRLLLGPRYALLRRDFTRWVGWDRPVAERARHVVITMGGGDRFNQTVRVMRAVQRLHDSQLEVKVIVGTNNGQWPFLNAIAADSRTVRFELLLNPPDIPTLLAWADVAIAAGGSTCWELCFMGVPSLLMTLVDNQAGITFGLAEAGAAVHLGWFNEVSEAQIEEALRAILCDPDHRAMLRRRSQGLVDGRGAVRVARALRHEPEAA